MEAKGINCPVCGFDTEVINVVGFGAHKIKNRCCLKRTCRHPFKTLENIPSRCPKCKFEKLEAKLSRPVEGGIFRRKVCRNPRCKFKLSSMEKIMGESKPKDIKPRNIGFGKKL